jgi:hypothetical protein
MSPVNSIQLSVAVINLEAFRLALSSCFTRTRKGGRVQSSPYCSDVVSVAGTIDLRDTSTDTPVDFNSILEEVPLSCLVVESSGMPAGSYETRSDWL